MRTGRKEQRWPVVWHGVFGKTPGLLSASESVVRLVAWEIGCRPVEL